MTEQRARELLAATGWTRLQTDYLPDHCDGQEEGWRIHDFPPNSHVAHWICGGLEEAEAKALVALVNAALSTPFAESAKSPSDSVTTPAARWREKGEPDPHGDSYDCERAKLCGGHLTDDEVAHQAAMLMRGDLNHEAVLQTAKDRIRWLSRQLVAARAALQSSEADK